MMNELKRAEAPEVPFQDHPLLMLKISMRAQQGSPLPFSVVEADIEEQGRLPLPPGHLLQ